MKEFKRDELSSDAIREAAISLNDLIREAYIEAIQRGIKANSILINTRLVEVPATWIKVGFSARQLPPMICGLNAYFTEDELPENYAFAVFEGPEYERKLTRLKQFEDIGMEPDELIKAAQFYKMAMKNLEVFGDEH